MTILADGICNAATCASAVTVRNAAPDEQTIELLPALGFRNTWSRAWITTGRRSASPARLAAQHRSLGLFVLPGMAILAR